MSKSEAAECEELIFSYISHRKQLKQLFLLLDIRREPDDREKYIVELAQQNKIDLRFVLTKCDKIPVSARKPAVKKIINLLDLNADSVLLYSTFDENLKNNLQEIIFSRA